MGGQSSHSPKRTRDMSNYLEISPENKKAYFERKAKIKSKAKSFDDRIVAAELGYIEDGFAFQQFLTLASDPETAESNSYNEIIETYLNNQMDAEITKGVSEALKIQKTKEYISLENDIYKAMLKMKDFLSDRPEILAKQYISLETVNAVLKGD